MVEINQRQLRQWREELQREISDLEGRVRPLVEKITGRREKLEALNRLLGSNGKAPPSGVANPRTSQLLSRVSTPRGRRISPYAPVHAYWVPILQSLVEMGGAGSGDEVIERVGRKMESILKPADYERLPSGIEIRWRNRAAWQRFNMRREGLLSPDSPRGIWEITEEGRKWLQAVLEKLKKRSA